MSVYCTGRILENVAQHIGDTPLIRFRRLADRRVATVLGKHEGFNPFWSIKDRVAQAIIAAAEKSGHLSHGSVVIEPSSGYFGVALAFACNVRGYRLVVTMPENSGLEQRPMMTALGAEILLTPAADGMSGAVRKAQALVAEHAGYYMPNQFVNPAAAEIHRRTTAEEIWRDTDGEVDLLVAGVGTGATITGIGEALKSRRPTVRVVAVEPSASPVLAQTLAGKTVRPARHAIQGIGAGFVPGALNLDIVDEVIGVSDEDAIDTTRRLAREEAIACGISSGAAVWAALQLAARRENRENVIVVVLPDLGQCHRPFIASGET